MMHEELLAKIDNLITVDKNYLIAVDKIEPKIIDGIEVYWKALRAVVELHRPIDYGFIKAQYCYICIAGVWPCLTIQAIDKELK